MIELTDAQEIYFKVLNKEIKRFPTGFWTGLDGKQNSYECGRLLFEDILKWSDDDFKSKYCKNTLKDNKLGGMLQTNFRNSPYEFLNFIYPERFKEWELSNVPLSYYKEFENRKNIIEFLLEDINYDISLFNVESFKKHKVEALLTHHYKSSLFKALEDIFPGKYKPWMLSCVPKGWWDSSKNRKEAILFLVNELEKRNIDIRENLSQDTFKEFGLLGLLMSKYNGVPFFAINEFFKDKYQAWEFNSTPDYYWSELDNRIKTIEWILKKCKKSINDLTYTDIKNVGLRGMLYNYYDNHVEELKVEYREYLKTL